MANRRRRKIRTGNRKVLKSVGCTNPDGRRWDAILARVPDGVKIKGVEIGVLNGSTSSRILKARPLMTLYMIDPWKIPLQGSSYDLSDDDNAHKEQEEHDAAKARAKSSVKFAGARAVILESEASKVIDQFKDQSLDFVFIDGDHSYEGVKRDIIEWLPKVKCGGWIGGHDYAHPRLPGVKKAVDEMFKNIYKVRLDVNRTWFVDFVR